MIRLVGASSLNWSTSEQVYTLEKNSNGDTLYCKEIDCGEMPNSGVKTVAHNISGLAVNDIFTWETINTVNSGPTDCISTHYCDATSPSSSITGWITTTLVYLVTRADRRGGQAKCRIVYAK